MKVKTKQFAGRTLHFVAICESGEQFYIRCEDEEGRGFVLGLTNSNDPMFMSREEAEEYWNSKEADTWKGETVWGMED